MNVIDTIWGLASWIEDIALAIWDTLTALYGILSTVYSIVSDFMGLFPTPIQALIIVVILIMGGYYIYNWVKDISIAGFKI